MSKQLALVTPEIQAAFQPQVLDVIRTSLCPTATDAEFVLFAHKAASYGLDPFKNEIFFIKYGQQARIQFAAEAYLAKAREMEGFQPPDTQMVCENDEFKVRKNPETKELEVVTHDMGMPRGKIIGAYSIAYRDGYRPVTVVMDISEVEHMFSSQNKDNWNKWTTDMFGKHVEQRALKKQYGLDFGDDDIPQQGTPVEPYERKDITNEVNAATATKDNSKFTEANEYGQKKFGAGNQQSNSEPTSPPPVEEDEATKLKKARAEMKKKFGQLGITDPDEMQRYIAENAKVKGEKPTLQEITSLLKVMDLDIQARQAQQADDELPI